MQEGQRVRHEGQQGGNGAQGARVKPIPPVLVGGFDLFSSDGFTVHLAYSQLLIVVVTVFLMAGFTYAWFALLATAIVASFASGVFGARTGIGA